MVTFQGVSSKWNSPNFSGSLSSVFANNAEELAQLTLLRLVRIVYIGGAS